MCSVQSHYHFIIYLIILTLHTGYYMIQVFYMLFTIKKIDSDFSKLHFLEL